MIIDAHVHIGSWRAISGLEDLKIDFKTTLSVMESHGIEGACVFPSDSMSNKDLEKEIQLYYSRKQDKKFRLWYLIWFHPGSRELKTHSFSIPVKGIKIHGSLDKTPTNSSDYNPAYEFAEKHNLPVIIHCGRWLEMSGWHLALEVAKKYRDVKFVLAHAGGNSAELRWQCANAILKEKLDNVWLDLTGMGLFWMTEKIIKLLGADKFLFGSDFPLGHPKIHLAHIEILNLNEDEKEKILFKNAVEVFGKPSLP